MLLDNSKNSFDYFPIAVEEVSCTTEAAKLTQQGEMEVHIQKDGARLLILLNLQLFA